ncbi:hypothetical protein [Alkalibaculum bacchi]|nr:hypothetical protein [Alkalibaculum bacchi]
MILAVFGLAAKVFSLEKLGSSSNSLPQILILFACVFLLIYRNKISAMHAIISSLTAMLLQLVFEMIYIVIILQKVLRINVDTIFNQSASIFSLIGLPYLVALNLFILLIYKVKMKRRLNDEYTGSTGEENM